MRSRKVSPALGRDAHDDAVGQHPGATGHRRAVPARLPDDRGRLAGDGRLVHRGDALDDLAVGGDRRRPLRRPRRSPLASADAGTRFSVPSGVEEPGLGLRAHLAQGVGLGLAPAFGHGLGEVGEQHRQEEPDGDGPVEDARVGDGLDEGDDGADQNHEHDGVLDLVPGVELLERVDQRMAEDLAVEEAPGLGHTVGRWSSAAAVVVSSGSSSEELSVAELLDDGAEGDGREEGEAADDHDHADDQADEHAVVGLERAQRFRDDVLGRQRTPEGQGRDHDAEPADQHVDGPDDVVEGGVPGEAGHGRAVVVGLRGEPVEDLGEPVRAGIEWAGPPGVDRHGDGGEDEHDDRHHQGGQAGQLHLLGLYLLAEVLRRSPDHQAADEHGDDGVDEDRVQPASRSPGVTSPSIMPVSGPKPPMGLYESVALSTAPSEVCVIDTLNKALVVSPNRVSLPSVFPTVEWTPAATTAGLFWCSA